MNTHQLDTKGLKCPMPVIKLQNLARQAQSGDQIIIEATDPAADKDIQSWCRINKHHHIDTTQQDQAWLIYITLR
jgi:tRNA 2-thiouridine synthesizing protein A